MSPSDFPMQSVIKSERVRVETSSDEPISALPVRGAPPAAKTSSRCQKQVQLLRENGTVHAIELRCSCGEVTVVEFEYDSKES